jgi:hypothetical protein
MKKAGASRSRDPAFVSQKALALRLELTERRVRQMVDEKVLSEPRNGRFDLALCLERYRLFRSKDPEAWADVLDRLGRDAAEFDELVTAALRPISKRAELTAASCAVQRLFSDLNFISAVKSRTDAERQFFWSVWCEKEDRLLGLLLGRAFEIIALATGMTFDQVQDAIVQDAA